MTLDICARALRRPGLTPATKLCLLVLAMHADESGFCARVDTPEIGAALAALAGLATGDFFREVDSLAVARAIRPAQRDGVRGYWLADGEAAA